MFLYLRQRATDQVDGGESSVEEHFARVEAELEPESVV